MNVYNYPGTAKIYWTSQPETWNGSQWVLLTPVETFEETGYYNKRLANGWTFFYGTRGWQNVAASVLTPAPAVWNVTPGHYYAAQDVTYWYNAAGNVLGHFVNATNYCAA